MRHISSWRWSTSVQKRLRVSTAPDLEPAVRARRFAPPRGRAPSQSLLCEQGGCVRAMKEGKSEVKTLSHRRGHGMLRSAVHANLANQLTKIAAMTRVGVIAPLRRVQVISARVRRSAVGVTSAELPILALSQLSLACCAHHNILSALGSRLETRILPTICCMILHFHYDLLITTIDKETRNVSPACVDLSAI